MPWLKQKLSFMIIPTLGCPLGCPLYREKNFFFVLRNAYANILINALILFIGLIVTQI